MGGGDLNLKKSWHPSTLRNIERVWKAEQKHEVEKQKIEQLQKELAEERAREEIQAFAEDQGVVKKRDERLDWMYQGPAAMVNRDDYLLGRKIDKTFEVLQQQEKGEEAPRDENTRFGSMFSNSTGNATVDLANKIREDPLFSIMKKEKEQRKSLLTNPVKMKQLQQILKMSITKEKKSKKSKNKKKKKSHSRSSDDEKHFKKRTKKYKSSSESTSESDHQDERHSKMHHSREHHEKKPSKRMLEEDFQRSYKAKRMDVIDSHHQKRDSLHKNHKIHRSNHYDEEHEPRESHRKALRQSSDDYHRKHKDDEKRENKKKLSSDDRERLLQEMQENAKWREDQRRRNTQRYQEEAEREDNFERVDASHFLRPMLSKAASKGSLENRVKQKAFSIQRNQADMNKHFARR